MRLVYLGTPEMAVRPLYGLVAAGHDVALVVTGEDRRRGRRGSTSPSPVKAAALELSIPVSHEVDDVLTVDADLGVVVAFGQIVRPHVLERLDMINLHFSLLPRWRGAAPVERAILAGDTETGVCVMEVAEGLDTGGIFAQVAVPISPTVTAPELRNELTEIGTRLLVDTLADGLGEPVAQEGEATYAHKFTSEDFRIDWQQPVERTERLIRVGGAWTTFRGERFKIHSATIVDGELIPLLVQPAGKPVMEYDAWRNGAQPAPDEGFE